MKNLLILFSAVMTILLLSCNQGGRTENAKDLDKSAMLVENAEVEGEEGDGEPQSVEDFVREAASGSLMELELGRYAQQNASNERVKNFGAMMVRDHTRANDELKTIASGKNLQVPATMENNHQNTVENLKKEESADFDKEYMKEMVDAHEKDIDRFRKQSEDGKDPDIKAFAAKTLQVLLVHQDSAKSINDALNR
jgi:putative membrane protein